MKIIFMQVLIISMMKHSFSNGPLWMKLLFQWILNLEIMLFLLDGIVNKLHKSGMLVQALELYNNLVSIVTVSMDLFITIKAMYLISTTYPTRILKLKY